MNLSLSDNADHGIYERTEILLRTASQEEKPFIEFGNADLVPRSSWTRPELVKAARQRLSPRETNPSRFCLLLSFWNAMRAPFGPWMN